MVSQTENPALIGPGSPSHAERLRNHWAVVFTQEMRFGTGDSICAVFVVVVVTVVDGNHGGAKPLDANRWSNQMFRAVMFPCLAWLAIRPPTIVSVLIEFHEAIKPPEPP